MKIGKKHQELIDRYCSACLDEAGFAELEEAMRSFPEVRRRLLEYRGMETALRTLATPQPVASQAKPSLWLRLPMRQLAKAALFLLLTGGAWLAFDKWSEEPLPMAILVDHANAEFAKNKGPDNPLFGVGLYELKEGLAQLRFSNGADVFLRAPSTFKIHNPLHVELLSGNVRVIASGKASSFTVSIPGGISYVDKGTAFGVFMSPDTDESGIHVFDGMVDVKKGKKTLKSLHVEESLVLRNGEIDPSQTVDPTTFPDHSELGLARWKIHRSEWETSPGVIGYFSFDEASLKESVLPNTARENHVPDGKIVGARTVKGRWSGKGALLFDRKEDYVDLDIPGEFDALSYSAWIWVDQLDGNNQTIVRSEGYGPPYLEWQISPEGTLWLTTDRIARYEMSGGIPLPSGEWVHIASSISKKNRRAYSWINGKPAGRWRNPPSRQIYPGESRLGHWMIKKEGFPPETATKYRRPFRGRIDEFAIWNRVLTDEEVKKMAQAGQTSPPGINKALAYFPKSSSSK